MGSFRNKILYLICGFTVLSIILASCSPQVVEPQTPTPTPLPTDTPVPSSTLTPTPTEPPISSPTFTSTPNLPSFNLRKTDKLNPRNIQSVLSWFLYSLQNQDPSQINELISSDGVRYAKSLEGVQFISADDFLNQLTSRLSSKLKCELIIETDYYWQVWITNWNPPWEMTELCYGSCEIINPKWVSSRASFFFEEIDEEWQLVIVYLNSIDSYFSAYDYQSYGCTSN